ncbi:hypothetical protein [Sunxiuqinia indica]|uniref:hypothetical protein n=1 Tax=Sunxiuqinia indica TaxID=2692584 RepID=UPI001356AC3A|nr:hypothetical protein [Sunxiuqinia indica]
MLYEINNIGIKELKKRIKENFKLLFIFPFISVIYIILTYISMRGSLFFWITSPFLIILCIFIGIVSPIIAANRFNKVITKLDFENDGNIHLETGKVNFKKKKSYKISPSDIKSINEKKLAYGSGLANGLLIRLYTNEDLYLIEKFCSEFEMVKAEIKNKINTGANKL